MVAGFSTENPTGAVGGCVADPECPHAGTLNRSESRRTSRTR